MTVDRVMLVMVNALLAVALIALYTQPHERVLNLQPHDPQPHDSVQPHNSAPDPQPRKLFFDLGANCGNSYAYFQNPGSRVNTVITPDFTAYLFEPQPKVFKRWLKPLQQRVGERLHVFNAVVAASAGSVSFGVDTKPENEVSVAALCVGSMGEL